MLSIRPVHTSYEREEYTKPFGITPEDSHFVIAATDDGKFLGTAYGKIEGTDAEIKLMSLLPGVDDHVARFLLGKAALNYIDLHGGVNVIYTGKDELIGKMMGFSAKTDVPTLCLTGYFDGGHKN